MIFMAECFTFGGRESTRIVLGNIKDTSSNVLLLLLPLVVFFLSLSLFVNFVLGSQQARDKKKTRSTRHQFEPKALSIFFACMLQITADHLSDALSCALHFCSVLFPFVLYPILLPGILASARCQQTKLIFKMAKGGLKGVKGILWVRLFRSKSLTCFAWFF